MNYNPDTQKLVDIEDAGQSNWVRIYCKDGEVFEAWPDCMTYTTLGDDDDDDDDVIAISFIRRSGRRYTVAAVDIDRFEVLEPRK